MTRASTIARLLPLFLGACMVYQQDEISCLEAEAHLAPCCPGLRLYCSDDPGLAGMFGDEPYYYPCSFTLNKAERDKVIDLTCDEIRSRNYCSVRQLHRETGHWPCEGERPSDLPWIPDFVVRDLIRPPDASIPPDLAEPDLPILCAAGCPTCASDSVCARDLQPNLLPTCVRRCLSSRDCPTGTTCIDWLGADGRPLARPACFPSPLLWCGAAPICRADTPPPRCQTETTLETYIYVIWPPGGTTCVADGYTVEHCPDGCETLGQQGGRCR